MENHGKQDMRNENWRNIELMMPSFGEKNMETKTWNTRKKPIEIHEYCRYLGLFCGNVSFTLLLCLICWPVGFLCPIGIVWSTNNYRECMRGVCSEWNFATFLFLEGRDYHVSQGVLIQVFILRLLWQFLRSLIGSNPCGECHGPVLKFQGEEEERHVRLKQWLTGLDDAGFNQFFKINHPLAM